MERAARPETVLLTAPLAIAIAPWLNARSPIHPQQPPEVFVPGALPGVIAFAPPQHPPPLFAGIA
jgi:hypothetical protein